MHRRCLTSPHAAQLPEVAAAQAAAQEAAAQKKQKRKAAPAAEEAVAADQDEAAPKLKRGRKGRAEREAAAAAAAAAARLRPSSASYMEVSSLRAGPSFPQNQRCMHVQRHDLMKHPSRAGLQRAFVVFAALPR